MSTTKRTVAFLSLLVIALLVPTTQAQASANRVSCGGYSYVDYDDNHITVIELCDGREVRVTNGEVTINEDGTFVARGFDRLEFVTIWYPKK